MTSKQVSEEQGYPAGCAKCAAMKSELEILRMTELPKGWRAAPNADWLALEERSKALEEALRLCIAKRRGDAGPIAASMADARVLDEEVRDYIARADSAARAALEQSK
jgi:hypothetical protein